MKIITKPISEVIPYDNNPRNNDAAVPAVANSIREFGFKQPIVIDAQGVIIAGHTRLRAAESLGMTEVPCVLADDLTPEQVKAYRLADNRVAELATWEEDLLRDELMDLAAMSDIDMSAFAFSDEELDLMPVEDDGLDPEEAEQAARETSVKRGDIYALGSHRLMCGDATDPEDVQKIIGGVHMDLCVTDPPYGIAYEGKTAEALTIDNDDHTSASFIAFLSAAFANIESALKPGGVFYIWHADTKRFEFLEACRSVDLVIREVLVWVKNVATLGRQDYHWRHEPCLYGWKSGAGHYFIEDRTQTTVEDTTPDPDRMTLEDAQKYIKKLHRALNKYATVIEEKKPAASREHPTMKPIPLIARQIKNSSRRGESVFDPFAGSGTTLIACEQCGRQAYVMELDPVYAQVIINRWEDLTGKKAIKIN
ncbi:DNA modification methylase [Peptococcus simiae]|uniref:DNA modification methylase n=1 Tax=Peptococcus simiae TaxID=1643805 RepID=UPI003980E001